MEMAEVVRINRALVKVGKLYRALQASLLADLGLHPGQDVMVDLVCRHPEGQSVGMIAQALGVESPTVTRSLDRLESGGWLKRSPDPDDRRSVRIRPTRQALDAVDEIHGVWRELATVATRTLGAEDSDVMVQLLEQVRADLGAALEERSAGSTVRALAE